MKKKYAFDVLSDKECSTKKCRRKLKLRLIETKKSENIRTCFRCYKIEQAKREKGEIKLCQNGME